MKKVLLLASLALFSSTVLADNVIVTETKTWKSVPIVVDPTTNVYTVEETAVPEGNYYYSYSGYRCFKEKREVTGVNAVELKPKTASGVSVYCYPE
ncbi:MAG: hypothetical protein H0U57_01345 [Tatlockia sp.]|nr:hypothetical protein [Tatlockia sp.]